MQCLQPTVYSLQPDFLGGRFLGAGRGDDEVRGGCLTEEAQDLIADRHPVGIHRARLNVRAALLSQEALGPAVEALEGLKGPVEGYLARWLGEPNPAPDALL